MVANDAVRVRDLPPQLQEIDAQPRVGQATPPFGSTEGVRVAGAVRPRRSAGGARCRPRESIQDQLEEERVNLRAQRKLRDLRRDAVVEYR